MNENSSAGKVFELRLGQRVAFSGISQWDLEVFVTGIYKNPEGHSHHYIFSALPGIYSQRVPTSLMTDEVERLMSEGFLRTLEGPSELTGESE